MCDKVFAALSYEYPKISANIKKEKMQDAQGILKSMTGLSGQTPTGLSGPRGIFAKDLRAASWHAYSIATGVFHRVSDYPVHRIIRSRFDRIIRSEQENR